MNFFMIIKRALAISCSILIFLLIVVLVFLYSGKSLVNRENLSNYIKNAEILNMDINVIFNLEENGTWAPALECIVFKLWIKASIAW